MQAYHLVNGRTSESGDIGLAENSTEMNGVEGIVDGRLEECTMEAETIWICCWTHCVLRSKPEHSVFHASLLASGERPFQKTEGRLIRRT
jgi:hypothetical protein